MDRTTRPLVIIAAFAGSLAIGLLVTLWLLGGLRGATAPAAIGGSFRLTDQAGQTVTEKNLIGRPSIIFSALRTVPMFARPRCSKCPRFCAPWAPMRAS